jgi:hypothetical protein
VFLNQLYKPFIGVDVNEILSYLVRRDRGVSERLAAGRFARSGVLPAGARAGTGWVSHPSVLWANPCMAYHLYLQRGWRADGARYLSRAQFTSKIDYVTNRQELGGGSGGLRPVVGSF